MQAIYVSRGFFQGDAARDLEPILDNHGAAGLVQHLDNAGALPDVEEVSDRPPWGRADNITRTVLGDSEFIVSHNPSLEYIGVTEVERDA